MAPPEIAALSARLIVAATDAEDARTERLSLMASVADRDGLADVEYLYVVHDGAELCWALGPETWLRSDEGQAVWLGSHGLEGSGRTLPRGEYRVIVVDKAGERGERAFTLAAPDTGIYDLPSVRLTGSSVTLRSPYPVNTALFLDSGGNVTRSAGISPGTTALDALWPEGGWRTGADYLAVYGLEPKAEIGLLSWKIRLPD